jgi:hypothetical protein
MGQEKQRELDVILVGTPERAADTAARHSVSQGKAFSAGSVG